ncbi:MAG: heavy metal translocating P-type ATPase [Atopobiaceae bacterium]|nr:heavy metal translocating P-type ATPase [Atopobiaceae bacterium]
MDFSIVRESPGRLRLHLRSGGLKASEARGIEGVLRALPGVHAVQAHAANSSLLVCCDPSCRNGVLEQVSALDVLHLPTASVAADDTSTALAVEDERFVLEAGGLIAWTAIRRLLLPVPLRTAWVIARALGCVGTGLRMLLGGRLTVEVLDATAVGASVIRGTYGEADTIMFLLRLSDIMQEHASNRTRLTLEQGLVTRSDYVWVVEDGKDVERPVGLVAVGDLLHVRTGSVLVADGCVVSGEAEVNESSMTGEAALVHKEEGSSVFSGTAVEDGELVIRVSAPPGQARIDAIAQMVERSSELKAASQGRAERLADGLVPVAFASFLGILATTRNIEKALAVLMVDYSCAIRLSTPIAVMSAMREAASQGIVVKGGKYLEALADADSVVFDKTGTLTAAEPQLMAVVSAGRVSEDGILRLAACIEEHYPHSVARAVVRGARERGLTHDPELHADVRYVVAHGIAAEVGGRHAVIGSAHFVFEDEGVSLPAGFDKLVEQAAPGASVIYLAVGGELLGALCVDDPLRPGVSDTLDELRALGIDTIVMLTGDSEKAARVVAAQAGVDSYQAQVLPENKASEIERLEQAGHRTIMVGDGINDSPALAAASVSVALSDASDIARTVADVSIRDDSLQRLVHARALALRLQRRIESRYRFIVGFNTLLIVLGVVGVLPLTTAATLHNLSTVAIAGANMRPLLHAAGDATKGRPTSALVA